MIGPVSPGALAVSSPPAGSGERERLAEAAQQFEAILVRQMLAAARSADFGGDDLFGGEGEQTFREMRDSEFARLASESGALGLAARIEAQLAQHLGEAG